MNPLTAKCFLFGLAAMARIEGMKAENLSATSPEVVPYKGNDFFAEAAQLEQLAIEVINQNGV